MKTFREFLEDCYLLESDGARMYTLGPAPEYTKPGSKARKKQVAKMMKQSGAKAIAKAQKKLKSKTTTIDLN